MNQSENHMEQTPENQTAPPSFEETLSAAQNTAEAAIPVSPTPKKPARPIPTAVIVILVVILGIAGALYAFSLRPESVVYAALHNTSQILLERGAMLDAKLPARGAALRAGAGTPSETTFSVKANDYMDSTGLLEGALMKAIFGGLSAEGTYAINPSAKAARLDANVGFYDKPLLEGEIEISPEQASLGLPGIIEGAYSISPANFAQDYKDGPFMEVQPVDDETLRITQELYSAYVNGFFAAQKTNMVQVRQDIMSIAMGVVADAKFQRTGIQDGNMVYTVELQGDKVRETVLNAVRYWYIDSAFGKAYASVAVSPYDDYKTLVEEYIIAPMAKALTDMPTTVQLHIDGQKVIRRADVTTTFLPHPDTGAASSVTACNGAFALDEAQQMTAMVQMEQNDEFLGPTVTTLAFQEKLTDTTYDVNGTYWTENSLVRIQGAGSIMLDSNGKWDVVANVTAGEGETQTDINITYNAKAALTEAGSVVEVENLSGALQTPQDFTLVSFSGKLAFEPVAASDVALRTDVTPILSMSYPTFVEEVNRLLFILQNAVASVAGG